MHHVALDRPRGRELRGEEQPESMPLVGRSPAMQASAYLFQLCSGN
jgi:hypothetical protein